MKRLLLPLLAALALPIEVSAGVDQEIHKRCLEAKDYLGCVKAQTNSPDQNNNVRVITGEMEVTGNMCPSGAAYIDNGYCQKIVCVDMRGHDNRLRGKGWKVCGWQYPAMLLTGQIFRASTDERCPLVAPEVGRNNSCQNGLEEKVIYDSNPPIGMDDYR
tara:strand:- start:139 stop:618 length:480 start_codon:yes stop_codon:yes gene_type:complete